VAEELKLTTVTCPENVPPSTRSVCFSEPPSDPHQDLHPNDTSGTDCSRVEYVSDESGSSWHVLERTTSHSSRPDISSQSPRSALVDFSYAESAVGISRKVITEIAHHHHRHVTDGPKILELRNPNAAVRVTYAIPGGDALVHHNLPQNPPSLVPVRDIIGFDLPDAQICDVLVETYFFAVHWFSLVIYEPKFRVQYQRIITTGYASRSEYGFLLLLLMVLSLGCWYGPIPGQSTSDGSAELGGMHDLFLKKVREQFMDMMDEDSLEYVQLCTLLGSFYLYHGRPRSSFSILGAATKSAQAMGLHRDSGSKFSEEATEERKRLWWTIYTWDRYVGPTSKSDNGGVRVGGWETS
jgi:Fungal specific transcription factor domain